jgi:hypothetical protein
MKVSAFSIDAFTGMPHYADWIALVDRFTYINLNCTQVRVEAIIGAPIELMFNHDISAVIRVGWNGIYINYFPCRDRVNNVQGLAVPITLEWADVNPLVKACVKDGRPNSLRIPDKSVLPPFPCIADLSLEIAPDVLIECRAITAEQRVIIGR